MINNEAKYKIGEKNNHSSGNDSVAEVEIWINFSFNYFIPRDARDPLDTLK